MSEKADFYKQNERFSGLIKHYARKIGDRESEQDLWAFLWVLQNTSFTILPDRYIAVCLRNKYYELLKKRYKNDFLPLVDDIKAPEIDNDLFIDLRGALDRLEESEKELILEHFYNGKTYSEIAKKDRTTRQSKSQQGRRILVKLRGFF
jgi:DNA-directed RNA polymerase specialized sigma subunit